MFRFPHVDPDIVYWYISWNITSTNRELNLKNNLGTPCLRGWGFHTKLSFFLIPLVVTCALILWCLDYRALLDLPSYGSDSWKRYDLKVFISVLSEKWRVTLAKGQVNSLVKRFAWWDFGLEETVYGALSYLWDLEEQKDSGVKVIIWGKPQKGEGGIFMRIVNPLDTISWN